MVATVEVVGAEGVVLTFLLLLPSPSGDGRVQCSSPWEMVVMVVATVEVVGEEGAEGVVLTFLLLLPSPSGVGRVQCSSPWDMVVMVVATVAVVGEEGAEGVVLTFLLLLPSPSSISSHPESETGRMFCRAAFRIWPTAKSEI